MKFVLIRHGETYANTLFGTENQILIGAMDNDLTQLNDKGKLQACLCRNFLLDSNLIIDEVYVSDLGRTKETASIIFEDRNVIYTPLIRERSLGWLEGKCLIDVDYDAETKPSINGLSEFEIRMYSKSKDGESYIDVLDRIKQFLSSFNYNDNKTVAVVSHFHCLRIFISVLLGKELDEKLMDLMINNSEAYIFEYNGQTFDLISDNLQFDEASNN